jgi:hypothetical protein
LLGLIQNIPGVPMLFRYPRSTAVITTSALDINSGARAGDVESSLTAARAQGLRSTLRRGPQEDVGDAGGPPGQAVRGSSARPSRTTARQNAELGGWVFRRWR